VTELKHWYSLFCVRGQVLLLSLLSFKNKIGPNFKIASIDFCKYAEARLPIPVQLV